MATTTVAKLAPPKPKATYWMYVGAESADLVHRIRFGPECPAGSTPTRPTVSGCAVVERTIGAGEMATEAEGPHGLQISRDGKYLHMTTGHGSPDGKYWKYELGPDTLVGAMAPATCSPVGAQPSATATKVYVACNKSDEILEIDDATWAVTRRFATVRAPYSLAVTPDGKLLIATLKAGSGVQVFDLATGKSMMQEKTSIITLAHGVTVSSDSRYAFVSVASRSGKWTR
jgi:DNA-binding beta-propeller fold protein YncE